MPPRSAMFVQNEGALPGPGSLGKATQSTYYQGSRVPILGRRSTHHHEFLRAMLGTQRPGTRRLDLDGTRRPYHPGPRSAGGKFKWYPPQARAL